MKNMTENDIPFHVAPVDDYVPLPIIIRANRDHRDLWGERK
jgi:hypothetical protein